MKRHPRDLLITERGRGGEGGGNSYGDLTIYRRPQSADQGAEGGPPPPARETRSPLSPTLGGRGRQGARICPSRPPRPIGASFLQSHS